MADLLNERDPVCPATCVARPRPIPVGIAATGIVAVLAIYSPDIQNMLVVGFGGGVALEGVPATVASVDVVELEPQVIGTIRQLSGMRDVDPLADPRINVVVNDARNALTLMTDEDLYWMRAMSARTLGDANRLVESSHFLTTFIDNYLTVLANNERTMSAEQRAQLHLNLLLIADNLDNDLDIADPLRPATVIENVNELIRYVNDYQVEDQ